MDIDTRLQQLWQQQQPPEALSQQLLLRVQRQQRLMQAWRVSELLLSVGVTGWFAHLLWTQSLLPRHWLLLPFFSVFLVVSWAVVLRQPRVSLTAACATAAAYAAARQRQLRAFLSDLKLAERSANGLLFYAGVVLAGSMLFGDGSWQGAALDLLVYAALWFAGTHWLVRRKRRRALKEYRSLGRIRSAT